MAGDGAVVVGASLAGLCAARVLAEAGQPVTLVERDRLPDGPRQRPGAPQSRHAHLLFEGGTTAFEALLPGIGAELEQAGAVVVGLPGGLEWLGPLGWIPADGHRRTMLSCTRPLLEWAVRRRVLAHPHVRVEHGTEVVGLDIEGAAVRGVRVRQRQAERVLPASTVLDASGRGSRAPRWLAQAGFPAPAERSVDAGVGYATALFRGLALPRTGSGRLGIYLQASQDLPRFGIVLPVEDDRWIVAVGGMRGHEPPSDPQGFLRFAAGLRSPRLREALEGAVPDGPVHGFRPPASRRRHFERGAARPEGFVVIGDAACTFNPVYGQGMTVAARGALALRRVLAERGTAPGFAVAAQRAIAREADLPWAMAEAEDLRYATTTGGRRTLLLRVQQAYLDRVLRAVAADRATRHAFVDVLSLAAPPRRLFGPRVLQAVLRPQRG